jgi:chromosome partitioning protein
VDLWATEGVLDLARREDKEAIIVLNRARQNTRLGAEVAEAAEKLMARIADATLANRLIYAEALGQGRGAAEGRKTPAQAEVDALTSEVAQVLANG